MQHLLHALSGRYQTLSLPRVWLAVFGIAILTAGGLVLRRLLGAGPEVLLAWRDLLQPVLPWLLSLAVLPYSCSKFTGAVAGAVEKVLGKKD